MTVVELSELIDTMESGSRPKGGIKSDTVGIPSLGAEHLNSIGGFNFKKVKYVPEEFYNSQKKGIITQDDVLVVKDGATTGKVSFVGGDFPFGKASINEHLFKLSINKSKTIPKYVYYYLFSTYGKKQVLSDFRGATVGGISRDFIKKVSLPLPSIDKQERVVRILDNADQLIQKRNQVIALLDNYLLAIFIEMFGDPVKNSMKWSRVPLSDLLSKIESGHSPVCLNRPVINDEWGVLKLGAITKCVYEPTENKALTDIETPRPGIEVKKGDVLFSRKNTYQLVAACAYVWDTPPRLMMPDLIFRLVPRDDKLINPIYLQALLSFPSKRKSVQALAGGASGSMPNISKARLLNYFVEVPPIKLQNQFAEIIKSTQDIKALMHVQSKELNNQFQALMQKAFNGL